MKVEHAKNYSVFQIASNLAMACIISGGIIALTYFITNPIAIEKSQMLKTQAMQALVKDADKFEAVADKKEWFAAEKAGKPIAYVVPIESKGFSGTIKMLVAVTPEGKVIRYNILSHNETPGLGDSATKESFIKKFKDKASKDLVVVKDPTNTQNIEAMTGATITSRAVVKGVKEAVDEVVAYLGGK